VHKVCVHVYVAGRGEEGGGGQACGEGVVNRGFPFVSSSPLHRVSTLPPSLPSVTVEQKKSKGSGRSHRHVTFQEESPGGVGDVLSGAPPVQENRPSLSSMGAMERRLMGNTGASSGKGNSGRGGACFPGCSCSRLLAILCRQVPSLFPLPKVVTISSNSPPPPPSVHLLSFIPGVRSHPFSPGCASPPCLPPLTPHRCWH
jgi:hypothetical protein